MTNPTIHSSQSHPHAQPDAGAKPPIKRQFVNFQFFKVSPEWRGLDAETQAAARAEFLALAQQYSQKLILRTYSLVGIRADCDFMLWRISYDLETFHQMTRDLSKTMLGKYLIPAYSYLSMTKRSSYIDKISPEHGESRTSVLPGKYKYIFVYPFVKTREWYLLSLAERQVFMDDHIRVGNKYPSVKLNTTYSFGLDDQDFVVAFESDHPGDFLDLVMDLRETAASKFTVRDTPVFTCLAQPLAELVNGI